MKLEQLKESLQIAREVFDIEIETLNSVIDNLGEEFNQAIELMLQVEGRIVVTGMGKSGHIGAKIAATLASTGSPSFFVHPAEMGHGDLGMLKDSDLVLALSLSGNTEELRKVLPPIKKIGVKLISITGGKDSALAQYSDIVLHTPIDKEACPLDLAPTSSTTAALVLGDALAVTLMKHKNFQKQDFAKSHPLGSLGRSFIQVSEIMRQGNIPELAADTKFAEILNVIDQGSLGFAAVIVDSKLIGTITDGDLRRAQIKYAEGIYQKTARDIMSSNPKVTEEDVFATRAAEIMKQHRISTLVVIDSQAKPVGTLDLKDLLAQGFII